MQTSSNTNFVPVPPEIEEQMEKIRERWGANKEAIVLRRKKIKNQMSKIKGYSFPEPTKDIYGVDPDKMARDFENLHSVVKDD